MQVSLANLGMVRNKQYTKTKQGIERLLCKYHRYKAKKASAISQKRATAKRRALDRGLTEQDDIDEYVEQYLIDNPYTTKPKHCEYNIIYIVIWHHM